MKASGNFLKLLKARISQKYYEEYQKCKKQGLETDDSLFSGADFNGDGKVNEDDKNLFEEYISAYSSVLSDNECGEFKSVEDLAKSMQADTNEDGTVSDDEKSYLELIQSEMEAYLKSTGENNQNGLDIDAFAEYVLQGSAQKGTEGAEQQDRNVESSEKIKNLNALKEECQQIQANMAAVEEKYKQAQEKAKSAKEKQENYEERLASVQARYNQAQQSYNDALHKKLKEDGKRKKGTNSASNKNGYDDQLKEAKKNLNKVSMSLGKIQSDYGMATANKAYYDSIVTNNQIEYKKYTELYNTKLAEFSSMYEGLSPEEQSTFGENPFIDNNEQQ